jgi:hypothetical protein
MASSETMYRTKSADCEPYITASSISLSAEDEAHIAKGLRCWQPSVPAPDAAQATLCLTRRVGASFGPNPHEFSPVDHVVAADSCSRGTFRAASLRIGHRA